MNLLLPLFFLFCPIKETIPDGSFCYKGLHPREIIILDRDNSPILENSYQDLLGILEKNTSEKELLLHVLLFVRETLFDPSLCSMESVAALISSHYPGELEPEISLEFFLKNRIGVCRHSALTSAYFLHRLSKDGYLEGTTFLIRDDIPGGRHAWTLFLSEEGAWHLDTYWGFLENGKTREGFQHLSQYYGRHIMLEQKKRWANND